jgi:hypothetical protein
VGPREVASWADRNVIVKENEDRAIAVVEPVGKAKRERVEGRVEEGRREREREREST